MRTAQLRDIPVMIVTDLYDPALDNLTASLDHLTRCFRDDDKRLPIADEGVQRRSTSRLEKAPPQRSTKVPSPVACGRLSAHTRPEVPDHKCA